MSEELIPVVMFIMIGVVITTAFYFKHRTRAEIQKTVRVVLEKGQELSPELLDSLGEPKKSGNHDLRRALVFMALALATATFGYLLNEEDVAEKLVAIAMFPFFISLAYLAMWKLGKGEGSN
ncbi:DUF6249 domain-containing protein [Woeseia oceani]|uniref:DUF6249 domain-containing protein n=1 Tax=Woeseia oceani TaxID=1548547 RepID=A0A193LCK6_9GAMM|nr:DUF6249 domain-containing protein [Woeseia oceani]ANO50242.1 hypothetical protein BA177_02530 [Woeseia oceani]